MTRQTRKGFTLIELLVVISIIALLIGILLPALQRAKRNANALRDGTQLKQIHLAMTTYATSNGDRYPVPRSIDSQGYTEGARVFESPETPDEENWMKNRTGAVYSILIFNGSIVPEICISPNEPNGSIEADGDFHYSPVEDSDFGTNTSLASWDPSFTGTPASDDYVRADSNVESDLYPAGGNFSYAHAPLDGSRRQSRYWRNSFRAADPVMSNRGPVYSTDSNVGGSGVQSGATPTNGTWFLAGGGDAIYGENSDTLAFAGPTNSWAGNVVYNDNHVSLENSAQPESVTFTDRVTNSGEPVSVLDNLFVDETNEVQEDNIRLRSNVYMRMYGTGVDLSVQLTEEEFVKPIWVDGSEDLGDPAM